MATKIYEITISSAELAKILGIKHRGYISELVKDHGFPRIGHNRYPVISFMQKWIEYQKNIYEVNIEKVKAEKPQDLLARKNAELKNLQLMREVGKLVAAADVEVAWLQAIDVIISNMDGVAIKASSRLIEVSDTKEKRRIIQEEINNAKLRIANTKLDIELERNDGELSDDEDLKKNTK